MDQNEDILFERRGKAGVITLNRPDALNAVTDSMLTRLNSQLDEWEAAPSIERVIIKAVPGRAFSAGGDIRHLYERGMAKDYDFDFFAREYALNARIAKFPKPYIALIDGIAMGGGVGVSFHGSHCVGGPNMSFAMPEVGIGFFPDVGASYFLSRLPGQLGLYLGLTGTRIKWGDALACGLLTHACSDFALAEDDLCTAEDIDEVLNKLAVTPEVEVDMEPINRYFAASELSTIIEDLQNAADSDEWAAKTLTTMKQKSPTSLYIAFHQIRRGAHLSIEDCMRMEYRILRRILVEPDFYEGIRAAIIDKDNNPKWSPGTLADVDPNQIDRYFDDLGDKELSLS